MLSQFRVPELAADQGGQSVMLALGVPAGVPFGRFIGGLTVGDRYRVLGVAHAGGGELSEPGIEHRPQFRGGGELADAGAVRPLPAPQEPALPGAVGVGELPVRVQRQG